MDNKVVKMVSGRLGAPCVGCTDSRADFNDEEKVKKGSYLNMSATEEEGQANKLANVSNPVDSRAHTRGRPVLV